MRHPPQPLRQVLRDLEAELESGVSIDPELEQSLREVIAEFHATLDSDRPARSCVDSHHVRARRLSELALGFEVSHPTLADILNRLSHLLSNLGI